MPTDYRLRYSSALSRHFAPGETLIDVREAKCPSGSGPRKPPKPADPPPGTGAAVGSMGVADVVLGGVDAIDNLGSGGPTDWLVRLLFGRTARGRADSVAGGYALTVPRSRPLVVAVTDRRLLVLTVTGSDPLRPFGAPPEPVAPERLTSLWWVRRAQVTGARRRRHRLHGARLRICFRDGSWVELTGPFLLGRRGAGALRDALTR